MTLMNIDNSDSWFNFLVDIYAGVSPYVSTWIQFPDHLLSQITFWLKGSSQTHIWYGAVTYIWSYSELMVFVLQMCGSNP